MEIRLENIGKRFGRTWIFRQVEGHVQSGETLLINGHNGSGKSTLLQVFAGFVTPTEGKVTYTHEGKSFNQEFQHLLSMATPLMDFYPEMSLKDIFDYHERFRPLEGTERRQLLDELDLIEHLDKPIKNFSSGMKQRVKLSLALFSKTEAIFLDEPTSNLDQKGIDWYRASLKDRSQGKIVIICSNDREEDLHSFDHRISMS